MSYADALKVRYVKLHIELELTEDKALPVYKSSALRGGMGEMLLRMACIRNRDCDNCGFRDVCLVQQIMYPQMPLLPDFMNNGEGPGFLIECEDYRDVAEAGGRLPFSLLLFGKNIAFFSQYMTALMMLGQVGIGKDRCRFRVAAVQNSRGRDIMESNGFRMENYEVEVLSEYIVWRKKKLEEKGILGEIRFKTPLSLKYEGKLLESFEIRPVFDAACRRIYILDCFEGIDEDVRKLKEETVFPRVIYEEHRQSSVSRYSCRKNEAMTFRGIEGKLCVEEIPEPLLTVLLAGELLHIGRNTSFGFGRYRVF